MTYSLFYLHYKLLCFGTILLSLIPMLSVRPLCSLFLFYCSILSSKLIIFQVNQLFFAGVCSSLTFIPPCFPYCQLLKKGPRRHRLMIYFPLSDSQAELPPHCAVTTWWSSAGNGTRAWMRMASGTQNLLCHQSKAFIYKCAPHFYFISSHE